VETGWFTYLQRPGKSHDFPNALDAHQYLTKFFFLKKPLDML
jgi:hypothetical protein